MTPAAESSSRERLRRDAMPRNPSQADLALQSIKRTKRTFRELKNSGRFSRAAPCLGGVVEGEKGASALQRWLMLSLCRRGVLREGQGVGGQRQGAGDLATAGSVERFLHAYGNVRFRGPVEKLV